LNYINIEINQYWQSKTFYRKRNKTIYKQARNMGQSSTWGRPGS